MKIHRIVSKQYLPITLQDAWEFFSMPHNLNKLTPKDMSFKIMSGATGKTYAGQIICYRIRPFWNIPASWVTEITQCVEQQYFVDEQRFGPFRFWHHQHLFEPENDGVMVTDILHYALPFGIIGEWIGGPMVHQKVKKVFEFRKVKLNQIFM